MLNRMYLAVLAFLGAALIGNASILADHRVGIRVVGDVGEFYDRATGETFVPRGSNYIRLGHLAPPCVGEDFYHSTFNPTVYESGRTEAALAKMRNDGYNVVRVFLSHPCLIDTNGDWSAEYLTNVTDFLERAAQHDMLVLLATDAIPFLRYGETIPYYPDIDWENRPILTEGGVLAESAFWQDLIQMLTDHDAPLSQVLAYCLRNEAYFHSDHQPLTLDAGLVTTGNGQTYDMSDPEAKQRMMDENLVHWINTVRAAILEVDPTALVTVGFFEPQGPNPARIGDPRVIRTYWAIADPEMGGSSADFIDLHTYPGGDLTLVQYMENFEVNGLSRKPILMGEFGAVESRYWSATLAAQTLQEWQVESCQHGFDGWLLWTWDTDEQPELWNGLEESEVINNALAPANRPDACTTGAFCGANVAFGGAATASQSLATNPPFLAFDGLLGSPNQWSAGDFPPQWIEVDLGARYSIRKVRLVVAQSPDGETAHTVFGKAAAEDAFIELHEFSEFTASGQVLEYSPAEPWTELQFIRVETTASPSWVAWQEIEVVSGDSCSEPGTDGDGDGVDDEFDVCNNTPAGTPVDAEGRPWGDVDRDCDTDLEDYALFQEGFTGPLP